MLEIHCKTGGQKVQSKCFYKNAMHRKWMDSEQKIQLEVTKYETSKHLSKVKENMYIQTCSFVNTVFRVVQTHLISKNCFQSVLTSK